MATWRETWQPLTVKVAGMQYTFVYIGTFFRALIVRNICMMVMLVMWASHATILGKHHNER